MIYRVLFETVNVDRIKEFTDVDPASHHTRDVHQMIPNSLIPEDAWHPVTGDQTEDPWDQFRQLLRWASEDREFVRNVRLEVMTTQPVWEEVHP